MFLLVFLCQMVFSQELASHKLLGHSVTGRPIYADIVGHGEEVILMVAGVENRRLQRRSHRLLHSLKKMSSTAPVQLSPGSLYGRRTRRFPGFSRGV